ncbi:Iron complex transport system ATP-binding protein [Bosea sp. 62]|uniref:ABC transporter ATP-binding protein n=1 Tax=unclassified Bosea (in: a-proteobacteria) TaxID=2653178 RepID=UPI001258A026|nr:MULTISPECIES: ABC transporter ATP-binding protein [unclassified Bosea (in: a-proteobacteria)]CAD5253441.1 Iron complex transport system ATP-binding protein [Bosea sp. 7B]CAD5277846.1 Iron complex transport system ATP-binding protein [Bosea sp. 21B]CAD5278867.1 Iron complex transport system ATP-binding protein [Bosea sp. 46]VVT59724.1 Iron complex transport system ATP-binding protein [Bosea sp. EC-HK365B]VXB41050.1 Iron complex transport system ATP-binding protein [Bosea sp. 62]
MRIEANGIAIAFDGKPILAGIDLALQPGELVGLIGANGAGKTTLLRILADLLPPAAGKVLYDGKPAKALGRRALAQRLAFLAQGGGVQWQMRAEAVVALGRLPHRRPFADLTEADRTAINKAFAATDACAFRKRSLDSLSGGERVRVLLARALAVEAEMLLADEPLVGLDPRHQLEAMALFRRIAAAGTGVVVVLHDLSLAGRFCDRLVLLDQGRILADGQPAAVLDDANLASAFGIAVARGERGGEQFVLPWQALTNEEASR